MTTRLDEPQARRWTLDEYYQLSEQGYFSGERVMLIEGEIIEMPAQGHEHVKSVHRVAAELEKVFGAQHWVRSQAPFNVGRRTDPEPDVLVAPHSEPHYADHPDEAILVVEVSDSTLDWDHRKAGLYAKAGVEEYWIVNLQARVLEVYRKPTIDRKREFGHSYAESMILNPSDVVAPIAAPNASVSVTELLP